MNIVHSTRPSSDLYNYTSRHFCETCYTLSRLTFNTSMAISKLNEEAVIIRYLIQHKYPITSLTCCKTSQNTTNKIKRVLEQYTTTSIAAAAAGTHLTYLQILPEKASCIYSAESQAYARGVFLI